MKPDEKVQRAGAVTFYPEQALARTWSKGLEDVLTRVKRHFWHARTGESAELYVRGLLASVERKNGWQLAEQAGLDTPYRLQALLSQGTWGAGDVRDELRRYVAEHLGGPEGVLALDETGFLKKGTASVGVQRQYTGTAGRIENCQVGVFMAYVSDRGRALVDRRLYLPQSWAEDPEKRQQGHIPDEVGFATKPELARVMVEEARAAGVPFAWVTGDEVYGQAPAFRDWLLEESIPFVLAVPCTQRVCRKGSESVEVRAVAKHLWKKSWHRMSAGAGSKGERVYDWALVKLRLPDRPAWGAWLLVRRSVEKPSELAYYLVYAPQGTPMNEVVRAAGSRWGIEECFEAAKGEVGLDEYEVRSFDGWYRHMTLAMFAHAYLAVMRAEAPTASLAPALKGGPDSGQARDSLRLFKYKRGLLSR